MCAALCMRFGFAHEARYGFERCRYNMCTMYLRVCVPGFPREHCVVLVVTAKKQLADDRAALLGNRCHERRGASRSWMVLSVFSTHTCTRTHSQPTHTHIPLTPHKNKQRCTHMHMQIHIFSLMHTHIRHCIATLIELPMFNSNLSLSWRSFWGIAGNYGRCAVICWR